MSRKTAEDEGETGWRTGSARAASAMWRLSARALASAVAGVREELAPDPRLSVFEIDVEHRDGAIVLAGCTSQPEAADALHRRIAGLHGSVRVVDRIVRLPARSVGARGHAIVAAAVAPLLDAPDVAGIMISQALLGRRLLILRLHGHWYQCRSDDGYIGWVHRGYVHRVTEAEARAWELGAGGELCVALEAEVVDDDGYVLARLPWGARVLRLDDDQVALPGGDTGRVRGEVIALSERRERFPPSGGAVVETATRWLGVPYLWGGRTGGGVDCSGFVQAVYALHGIDLPRDSDLQAERGTAVEPGADFGALEAGDLLFFAELPERITHVTLSTGGSGIIHSSLGNGGVRHNDLRGRRGFERELRKIFIGARRLLDGSG